MPTLTSSEYEKIGRIKVLTDEIASIMAEMELLHANLSSLIANAKGAYAADQMALIETAFFALQDAAETLNAKRQQLNTLSAPAGGGDDYSS